MTALRSILVHLDGTPRCAHRLALARRLAQDQGAQVTALFATTPPLVDVPYGFALGAGALSLLQDLSTQWLARAKETFDASLAAEPGALGWAELRGEPVIDGVVRRARCADLLVLGQHDPADPMAQQVPGEFVSSVLIDSGRPALVVPYAGRFESVGGTALVAWKPSAAAARALAAALPLLQRSRQVHVLAWSSAGADGARDDDDLASYLAAHGVRATMHRSAGEPDDVGEALLSRAADLGAELLVMGCYGHHRLREFVLGGATRTVLRSMTVPVLMSH